ncbi:MAG: hypothetical protein ACKV2Q_05660 [Planctomycetaceae bacterium]
MSEELSNTNWSEGRFERKHGKSLPPIEVDCSNWMSEIPAEDWSTGQFQRDCQALPPAEVSFNASPLAALEITLTMEPHLKPEQAFLLAARLIAALDNAAPEVGVTYDPQRSRVEAGGVIIVVSVNVPSDLASSVEYFSNLVRKTLRDQPDAKLSAIHFARAA